jgi:hypothetical protein
MAEVLEYGAGRSSADGSRANAKRSFSPFQIVQPPAELQAFAKKTQRWHEQCRNDLDL